MTHVWHSIETLSKTFENLFTQTGEVIKDGHHNQYDWHNNLWTSMRYRRAHIEIVDKRDSHGIYILHSTVFPHYNDPSPIWGFDAVCGRNKITGAFHDFSNAGDPSHRMISWFAAQSSSLEWTKPRVLPEWAKNIFSPAMIAAGNIQDEHEIKKLCEIAETSLRYYLENVGLSQTCAADFHMAQNRYCYYQKQNPQVIKSMMAMGVSEPTIKQFVEEVLFPEVA